MATPTNPIRLDDLSLKFKILKETGIFPSNDNAFEVEVNDVWKKRVEKHMPKAEYHLLKRLNSVKKKITKAELRFLIGAINDWTDFVETKIENQHAMDEAGESL